MTWARSNRFDRERVARRKRAPARKPAFYALFAVCLVALQLVTALHFALVPHAFNAGLSGFVHVHVGDARVAKARSSFAERALNTPALERASASCSGESCPIGFAGQASTLVSASDVSALLGFDFAPVLEPARVGAPARNRVLLSAPKTSPPV
ncbi:MAG TPA: hypothetical protein VGM44_18820 [Polyangiaceae bacterium]|jgi:hypothetical protein